MGGGTSQGGPGGMFGPDLMGKLAGDPRTAGLLSDQSFISKVLVAIDKRVNCWLLECMNKEHRSTVDVL